MAALAVGGALATPSPRPGDDKAKPNSSYQQNSQASVTAMARLELANQRQMNLESPRYEERDPGRNQDNLIIPSVQLPTFSSPRYRVKDDGDSFSSMDGDAVRPEDSLTGRMRS